MAPAGGRGPAPPCPGLLLTLRDQRPPLLRVAGKDVATSGRPCLQGLAARLSPSLWELRGVASPLLGGSCPTQEAASLSPADPSPQSPGHGDRSVDAQQHAGRRVSWLLRERCWPWSLQGLWGSPSCPSGMLFSAHTAVVSDSCTWAGAGREFLSGVSWPKVTAEQGRLPARRRGGDLGRVTKVDSSGGLSEHPLGASLRPGTHQDRELKQEHIPS